MPTEIQPVLIRGEPLANLPADLFIPPEALRVILESFTGPLDLLLYLIKKQNLDILEVDVAELTRQYLTYIDLMQSARMDLAAEYLLMAAILLEMKSRLLLPRSDQDEEAEEEDPRAVLIQRLLQYEIMVKAAEQLFALPQNESDFFVAYVPVEHKAVRSDPEVELADIFAALQAVVLRSLNYRSHSISGKPVDMRARMQAIVQFVHASPHMVSFLSLFSSAEGRDGLVVTFIAILELLKERLVELVQLDNDFYLANGKAD